MIVGIAGVVVVGFFVSVAIVVVFVAASVAVSVSVGVVVGVPGSPLPKSSVL